MLFKYDGRCLGGDNKTEVHRGVKNKNFKWVKGERQSDPGLIVVYNCRAMHSALWQTGSPVIKGQTADESLKRFQDFVWRDIFENTTFCKKQLYREVIHPKSVGILQNYLPPTIRRHIL